MKSYAMTSRELENADYRAAVERSECCEKDHFEEAHAVGYKWMPTRELAWESFRLAYEQ